MASDFSIIWQFSQSEQMFFVTGQTTRPWKRFFVFFTRLVTTITDARMDLSKLEFWVIAVIVAVAFLCCCCPCRISCTCPTPSCLIARRRQHKRQAGGTPI
jgi:hypothetical protein